jgi:hypothetical protein
MVFTIFAVGYLVLSVLCAVVFYCACVIGARAERITEDEIAFDKSELDFKFDHAEWAEKAIAEAA